MTDTESTVIRVSHSQMGVWDSCQQRWKYLYVDNIVPLTKSSTYEVGTLFHEFTAIHDQLVMMGLPAGDPLTWEKVASHAQEEFLQNPTDEQIQYFGRALQATKRYILEHCKNEDKYVKILGVEDEFNVPLVTPTGQPYIINGYIDRLYSDEGRLWLLDRKTSGTGRHYSDDEMLMDPQLLLYAAAYRQMGQRIHGVAIDSVSTYNYKNYAAEPIEKIMKRIRSYRTATEMDFILDYYGQKVDEILEKRESWGFTRSLSKDCARCPYKDICLYDMKGIDTSILVEYNFEERKERTRRDPARLQFNRETEKTLDPTGT